MAITYEEALATLEAMFGDPWTRDTLDAVLRHEKGHMENTCERILNHGSQDPQVLIQRLKEGVPDNQMAADEELARQLQASQGRSKSSSAHVAKQRGTPTQLPADFLRIPGFKHRTQRGARRTTTAATGDMDDATLARMLQDELFSEELARNPDFAHLARGRRAKGQTGQTRPPASAAAMPPGPNVLENLSKLGEGARRRLQTFAINFENRLNGKPTVPNPPMNSGMPENTGAAAERRGLLDEDDDEEEIEFEMREKKSN
eukprot:Nitzschia sp. Nitz4//scaffold78_size91513//40920//41792//NITZ4_004926-RA/size91513-snap-gene-0.139-mRNA-1//-1//CDS//3329558121//9470//frame0